MATATAKPKKTKAKAKKTDVKSLLSQLAKCKDPAKAHSIRTQLRAAGHRGGLRGKKK